MLDQLVGLLASICNIFKDVWLFCKGRARERIEHDKKIYNMFSTIFSDIYIMGVIKGAEKDYSTDLVRNKYKIREFNDEYAVENKYTNSLIQKKFDGMVHDMIQLADMLETLNDSGPLSADQNISDQRKKLGESYKVFRNLIRKSLII